MPFYIHYPSSSGGSGSNPSVGTNGATAPTSSTEIGIIDGTGKLQGVSSSNPVPVSVSSLPIPSGAATAANQVLEIADLDAIAAALAGTLDVAVQNFPAIQPVSGMVTANQGTGGASAWKVDGSSFTQPVSGTFWQSTQPVSAASLPLPMGAATSANQTTANTSLSTIATNTGNIPTVGQKTMSGSTPVAISSDQSAVPIKAAVNSNGSGSAANATVSTVATLTAPSNAVGFILMSLDTSTANIRWAIGRTASATLGQQLQPARDTGFVPCGANVSICAESGTQNYDIQWVSQ